MEDKTKTVVTPTPPVVAAATPAATATVTPKAEAFPSLVINDQMTIIEFKEFQEKKRKDVEQDALKIKEIEARVAKHQKIESYHAADLSNTENEDIAKTSWRRMVLEIFDAAKEQGKEEALTQQQQQTQTPNKIPVEDSPQFKQQPVATPKTQVVDLMSDYRTNAYLKRWKNKQE